MNEKERRSTMLGITRLVKFMAQEYLGNKPKEQKTTIVLCNKIIRSAAYRDQQIKDLAIANSKTIEDLTEKDFKTYQQKFFDDIKKLTKLSYSNITVSADNWCYFEDVPVVLGGYEDAGTYDYDYSTETSDLVSCCYDVELAYVKARMAQKGLKLSEYDYDYDIEYEKIQDGELMSDNFDQQLLENILEIMINSDNDYDVKKYVFEGAQKQAEEESYEYRHNRGWY